MTGACVLTAGLAPDTAAWLGRRLGGAEVRAARSGREAVDALAGGAWSLLIVDHALRGPAAPEVVSAARDRLGANRLPVVYCLEPTAGGDLARWLVRQAGVQRLLFHPLDRDELARAAASCLDLPLSPSGGEEAPASARRERAAAALAALWEQSREAVLGRVAVLERAVDALVDGRLDERQRREAEREAHKLVGAAGTFGFPGASALAAELEQLLAGTPAGDGRTRAAGQLAALRRELEGAPAGTAEAEREHGDASVLLVVDPDPRLVLQLQDEAATASLQLQRVPDVAAARAAVRRRRPDVALVDLTPPVSSDAVGLVAELSAAEPPVPVLVVDAVGGLTERVEAAQAGARGFLRKPLGARQVVEAVTGVLERVRAATPTLLAVDDDPTILTVLRRLLAAAGLQVVTLSDPLGFWEALERTRPDLLILDVDLPVISGVELCRVVRADPRWAALPVLFLTAGSDAAAVQRVFAAGADDFVRKPIIAPELLTRISNRLERVRLYRRLADTDPLTSLANRRASQEQLGRLLAMARRYGQPVSLALLDLDRFKQVNDRHGHAAGDEVLARLGGLLGRTFRGEDVAARWGGEEFVLGLYGMTRDDGLRRVADTLGALRGERFTAADGTRFQVTCSAGVAQYPDAGPDLHSLYLAADDALRLAKQAGRDRVAAAGARPRVLSASTSR